MNQSSLAFETLVREAISACRAEKRKTVHADPDMAERLHEAAAAYAGRGMHGQAEELHLQAISVRELALGDCHPLVADSLVKLAEMYLKEERPLAAEPLVRRALAIRQRAMGPDHGSVAECLDILVTLYRRMGRGGDASLLAARAAEIRGFEPFPKAPLHDALMA